MKVSFLTLGCRMNQSETAVLLESLKESGATICELKDNPDYCVINTCTVTAKSDYNSRQLIRRAARAGAKVVVTGCYAQLKGDDVRKLPGVICTIDNRNKDDIISLLAGDGARMQFGAGGKARPHLKVQDGCNAGCSYCTVPLARGKSRSIPFQEVIERAMVLEASGYKEIVLTGIHLGTYGHDLDPRTGLNALLRSLIEHTRTCRFRLSSLEVTEIDEELLDLFSSGRVCAHLHIPLQSGSDSILRLMRRGYTSDAFRKKALHIVSRLGRIALGTDVIAGFPGEGEQEFLDTYRILSDLPFTYLHAFPFSPRPGTPAFTMKDRVPADEVRYRMARLTSLAGQRRISFMQEQVGSLLDVIIEDHHPSSGYAIGTSANYLKISVAKEGLPAGSLVRVRTTGIDDGRITAIPIETL